MMNGIPVIASDLPGVRQPVSITGMGQVVPTGDARRLAQAIQEVFERPQDFQGDAPSVKDQFSPEKAAKEYEKLFLQIRKEIRS
jgi:glycosyltransferase involved in cell wall biosynthesis